MKKAVTFTMKKAGELNGAVAGKSLDGAGGAFCPSETGGERCGSRGRVLPGRGLLSEKICQHKLPV